MVIYSGFTHWKWWFSIVMLVYQRVDVPGLAMKLTAWWWLEHGFYMLLYFVHILGIIIPTDQLTNIFSEGLKPPTSNQLVARCFCFPFIGARGHKWGFLMGGSPKSSKSFDHHGDRILKWVDRWDCRNPTGQGHHECRVSKGSHVQCKGGSRVSHQFS